MIALFRKFLTQHIVAAYALKLRHSFQGFNVVFLYAQPDRLISIDNLIALHLCQGGRHNSDVYKRQELEIEAFVHGAMCMSISGRCLLSNYMAGRDANRGQCAQPLSLIHISVAAGILINIFG